MLRALTSMATTFFIAGLATWGAIWVWVKVVGLVAGALS